MTTAVEETRSPRTRQAPRPSNGPDAKERGAVATEVAPPRVEASRDESVTLPVPRPKKRLVKRLVMAAALAAALVAGGSYGWSYYKWAAVHETTDDAFVDGHVTQVTPRVGGHVLKVYVNDNQEVHAGDLLVELDPADFLAAVAQAEGKLTAAQADLVAAQGQVEQAKAQVATAEAQVEQAKADTASKEAQFQQASQDLQNYTEAHKNGVVSTIEWNKVQTDVRTTQAARDAAMKAVAAAQAEVAQAKATLAAREGQVAVAKAEITTAQAALQTAKLNLSYTKIVAAMDGRVTKKNVEPGDYVIPAQVPALMGVVNNDVWVTANFKETQLAHMKPGDPVDVKVDAYPGVTFHGHVDSIQQGAGAWFSLLPPENATGNYVKVVQRVPVKIVLDHPDPKYLLGPGMSVDPEVSIK